MAGYLSNINILVVDNNAFYRGLVCKILAQFGARKIREAVDGQEAIKAVEASVPDIVITDWVMKPMGGMEFINWVRSSEGRPWQMVPIIMMSAYSDRVTVATARDIGINEFVAKPVSPLSLLKRVEAVISKPRMYIRSIDYFGPDRRRQDVNTTQYFRRNSDNNDA